MRLEIIRHYIIGTSEAFSYSTRCSHTHKKSLEMQEIGPISCRNDEKRREKKIMWIVVKQRRNRPESLFVFEFSSFRFDYEPYIANLKHLAAIIERSEPNCPLNEIVRKMEARCDGRYARRGVAASFCLFADEMAILTTYLSR